MAFAGFCSIAAKLFTVSGAKSTGKTCVEKAYFLCSKDTHVGGDPVALLVFSFAYFSVGEMSRLGIGAPGQVSPGQQCMLESPFRKAQG